MDIWHIRGGRRLCGTASVQGAKNAVLPILAASVLTGCETRLSNCPDLMDVDGSVDILRCLGCRVERSEGGMYINSSGPLRSTIPHDLMSGMRSSVIFLGAVLARCGEAVMAMPGGCELGPRPIDLHLSALRDMRRSSWREHKPRSAQRRCYRKHNDRSLSCLRWHRYHQRRSRARDMRSCRLP